MSKLKLILCHNQTMRFNDFFSDIQNNSKIFEYSGYSDLLFVFDYKAKHPAEFINLDTGRKSWEYTGAYVTGYLECADLAFAASIILRNEGAKVVDSELDNPPSFSKISEAAKLASARIPMPKTYGGTKIALVRAITTERINLKYPIILKRADGERGSDNYTIYSSNEIFDLFQEGEDSEMWVMQEKIESDGFYRCNCYYGKTAYGIFRSLSDAPDDLERHRAHMYKPAGGSNATFLEPREIRGDIKELARKASKVVRRQFSGVDIIVNKKTNKSYILEVNFYPQLVTVESFKERRVEEFLKAMKKL